MKKPKAKHGRRFLQYAALVGLLSALVGCWSILVWFVGGGPLQWLVNESNWRQFFPDLLVGVIGAFLISLLVWRIQVRSDVRRARLASEASVSAEWNAVRISVERTLRTRHFAMDFKSLAGLGPAADRLFELGERPLQDWKSTVRDPALGTLIRTINVLETAQGYGEILEAEIRNQIAPLPLPKAQRELIEFNARLTVYRENTAKRAATLGQSAASMKALDAATVPVVNAVKVKAFTVKYQKARILGHRLAIILGAEIVS